MEYEVPLILTLPPGDLVFLGLHFSKTVPCEICRIDEKSPIFYSSLQYIGRLAYHLTIPNKIGICGALDHETIEKILMDYSNISNRVLIFKKRGDHFNEGLVTTTILPTGPIDASFCISRGLFTYNRRVLVETAPTNRNFEFPIGHFIKKVIIPNQLVLEGGLQTTDKLIQTLDQFAEIPQRKIVFDVNIPKGGIISKMTLPKGPIDVVFVEKLCLPFVSIAENTSRLNIPVGHFVEKLIVPNEIKIERIGSESFEKLLGRFSQHKGRVVVLKKFRNDFLRAGATVTITLPTGDLGIVFNISNRGYISVAQISENSGLKGKIPLGYTVQSLVIPGELEPQGLYKVEGAVFKKKLEQYSQVPHRIMLLKQFRRDIQINSLSFINRFD